MKNLLPDIPKTFKGIVLLASPSLNDSIFSHSCILIYKESDQAHEGFILNKPTNKKVSDLISNTSGKPVGNLPIHIGGPVEQGSLNFFTLNIQNNVLHYKTFVSIDEANYFSEDPDTLVTPCVGHSSWHKGQLKNECEHYTWFYDLPNEKFLNQYDQKKLWLKRMNSISPYHSIISKFNGKLSQN